MSMRVEIELRERDGQIFHTLVAKEVLAEDEDDDIVVQSATERERVVSEKLKEAVEVFFSTV